MGVGPHLHGVGTSGSQVGQHGGPEMPCWVRSQCHRQSGSCSSCLKDVCASSLPLTSAWIHVDFALGPVPGTRWSLPLHCWMDLESHLPRSQSLRVGSKLEASVL